MYPWDVLGLEPTDDRKAIKKAYSVLLKKHRPDEDPEGFQQVNQAYQSALKAMKQGGAGNAPRVSRDYPYSEQSNSESQKTGQTDTTTSSGESAEAITLNPPGALDDEWHLNSGTQPLADQEVELVHPNPPEDLLPLDDTAEQQPVDIGYAGPEAEEPDAEQLRQLQLAEDLFRRLHEMAFAPLQDKADLSNWRFLMVYHDIDDFSLRDQVAREVFRRVAEYNLFQRKETGLDLIPPDVLHHMAGLFNWEANWLDYSNHFPEHYLRCVFTELEKPVERIRTNYKAGLVKRLLAFKVDFVAYFLLLGMLASLIEVLPAEGKLYYYLGFAGFRLGMELLMKNRSTFGTNYLGYRFLDQYLNQPARKVILKRFLALELMLVPFYLIIAGLFSVDTVIMIVGGYAVIMVVMMFLLQGRLPHDVLSGTVAVKKLS